VKTCIGTVSVPSSQAKRLGLKPSQQLSPVLVKCCLVASAKTSYEQASEDIELMTGMKVSHSSLHRLVQRVELLPDQSPRPVAGLSVDGGKVRLRTPQPGACEWRDYKAVSLHGSVCNAYFQDNEALIAWVQQNPLRAMVTCVGDGHDGVWNLITKIASEHERREVLDWYHLMENLYKVDASPSYLKEIKTFLWSGLVDEALEQLKLIKTYPSQTFRAYLKKHRHRIVPYDLCQALGLDIGSGAVESTVKRIGARLKLSGAQWSPDNVAQMLRLRCAYLNRSFSLSIST
jgi:hypothetical protein